MSTEPWCELMRAISATVAGTRDEVSQAVSLLARVRCWIDAEEMRLAGMMAELSPMPERDLAEAARSTVHAAERALERAALATKVPALAEALVAGRVTGEHLDAVVRELRRVEPEHRDEFLAGVADLAAGRSPDELVGELRRRARRLAIDDGGDRLTWQQSQVRLSSSLHRDSGLTRWTMFTDPVNTVVLDRLISAQVEAMFHSSVPEGCPTDPLAKQQFLRAHALLALAQGKGAGMGRPEVIVVVDTTVADADGGPVIDWGLPVEIPRRVLESLMGRADVHAVVVRNGVVLHAPGTLDLGRSTRIANRAQRRALRALYARCAVPGCRVRFDQCAVHHVRWWRHGGSTDLENLLPLCSRHHHAAHEGGWQLALQPDRTLTITLPDGRVMTTGPPTRRAA